ncbi:MAG TPA: M3 family oligoendopeptidase [Tepidisphaeraceae bacterium]|jgi:oligoendopeptidase F|nr:M3 family oligoendopeptidase [Tepidisphaeraceae bacterium]
MPANAPARRFVPPDLDPSDFSKLEKLYRELLDRKIGNVQELKDWLEDFSELASTVDEYGCRRYIDKSCHTDDEEIKKRFLQFVEEVEPRAKPLAFALQKKYLDSPLRQKLERKRFDVLDRRWQAEVEIFREENVPIETEITRRVTEYDQINGRMTVDFRGQELTMQQIARYLEDPEPGARKEAWESSSCRRLVDREAIELIFEALLPLRQKIAQNAGLSDYRAYQWKANKRFDYTPEDCLRFADAIAEICVPMVRRLDRQRAGELGLSTIRPWDSAVDVKGRPALRPFDQNNIDVFVQKTREIFNRLSPALAADFDQLRQHGNLDLQSRKGKQPGGYLMPLEESRQPFIFMNAAGMQRDVETLLHEGGHAFHHLAAAREDLVFLRSAPMEFCEVASMSMELLGSEHLGVFYDEADTARAKRKLIEGIIQFFPWMAIIDSFQHWLYTHAGHRRDERQAKWMELLNRFGGIVDWSGWEAVRESLWQRQGHLFHAPFYYVEYGIAQLGALQLWMKARQDPHQALANYRAALALGGTRPLPQLFAAAGIVFDFSQKTLRPLMDALGEELERLPA